MTTHKMLKTISLSGLILFLGACDKSTLPPASRLQTLRVLAVVADTPELSDTALPATVQVTPYISDMKGSGRVVTMTASACPDPGVSYGANPTCAGNPQKVDIAIPNLTPVAQTANSGIFGLPNLTGAVPSFSVSVPAGLLTGRSPLDQHNGVAYLVTFTVSAGSESVSAFKRIFVSNKTALNTNPTLTDILGNGASLTTLPAGETDISGVFSGTESYEIKSSTGTETQNEKLYIFWYSNLGDFSPAMDLAEEKIKWTPPGSTAAGKTVLMGVIRDGRGGTAVKVIDL